MDLSSLHLAGMFLLGLTHASANCGQMNSQLGSSYQEWSTCWWISFTWFLILLQIITDFFKRWWKERETKIEGDIDKERERETEGEKVYTTINFRPGSKLLWCKLGHICLVKVSDRPSDSLEKENSLDTLMGGAAKSHDKVRIWGGIKDPEDFLILVHSLSISCLKSFNGYFISHQMLPRFQIQWLSSSLNFIFYLT